MSAHPTTRLPLRADLLLLLVTVLAAAGWIFSKEALNGMPPLLFIGTRFLLAGAILVVFALPRLRRLSRRDLLAGTGVALLINRWRWVRRLFTRR